MVKGERKREEKRDRVRLGLSTIRCNVASTAHEGGDKEGDEEQG